MELFLDAAAAMDTIRVYLLAAAFLLPLVSSRFLATCAPLLGKGHLCLYGISGVFPDFRAPTLGLIFIRALSVERLQQALGAMCAASAHQHTSLVLDQLWPSFSNDNRWPG